VLYDKPWYRPGYYVGVLLACMYVDFRDPVTKSMKKFTPVMLALWWTVLIILFVCAFQRTAYGSLVLPQYASHTFACVNDTDSSVGEVIFHNVQLQYGEMHSTSSNTTYMGSKTVCAWSPSWDLVRERPFACCYALLSTMMF
jgi:hypothetical protein